MSKETTRTTRTTQARLGFQSSEPSGCRGCELGGGDALRRLVSPVRPVYPVDPEPIEGARWVWIRSRLLGETILLVLQMEALREAEEAHPDALVYVVPEMEVLAEYADQPEVIRALHRIKKELHGWIHRPEEGGE